MSRQRTKIEIIENMLDVIKKGGKVNKTKIVYGSNLNFDRTAKMLKWLIEKKLVKMNLNKYEITERGEEVLREIYKLCIVLK